MANNISIGNIVIDCNNAVALRDFYAALLGGEAATIAGHPVLRSNDGLLLLFSNNEVPYEKPVWPEVPNKQQKQMHFDFHVEDLPSALLRAEKLGAQKAAAQFGEEHYITLLDPEGHPFCLCKKG